VALSSAILYLAIVGIWAVVLVPRWLRPPYASGTLESNLAEPVDASLHGDLERAEEDEDGEEGFPGPGDQVAAGPAGPAGSLAAERRAAILRARRRTMTTLVVLTAGAVAIAVAHLAASWVVIPPAVMLAGFVLLLREAARIDIERVQAAASRPGLRTDTGAGAQADAGAGAGAAARDERQHAGMADRAQAGGPSAKIIDISARVGDQLYDQYADAEVRAVGD
jgi:hypothetical protein